MNNLINISEQTTFTIQVNYSDLIITKKYVDKIENISATGIMIKPNWIEVIPSKFRSQIVCKDKTDLTNDQIYKDLLSETYYLNIQDYSDQELNIACNFLVNKWIEEIWTSLTKKEENYTISLKDDVVLKHVLKMNQGLFKTKNDFDNFCIETGLKIENFIVPATFSYLNIKLKEIALRLEMEQFYARRFLFTETLIRKIKLRLKEFLKHNSIDNDRKKELEDWINDLAESNRIYQQYKDYQQLYDMPKQEIKIEKNENVNFINGNVTNSEFNVKKIEKGNKDSLFDKRVKIIGAVTAIIAIIVTIIINWDKIIIHFK